MISGVKTSYITPYINQLYVLFIIDFAPIFSSNRDIYIEIQSGSVMYDI